MSQLQCASYLRGFLIKKYGVCFSPRSGLQRWYSSGILPHALIRPSVLFCNIIHLLILSRMKAIYITKTGPADKAFQIKETEIPNPAAGEICIKVECFGLNFADVLARQGLYQDAPPLPSVIGYDVAGFVHAIGADVTEFSVGQRVTALTRFGGYAEYATTMVEGASAIPDHLDFATATALATQACTAYFCTDECVNLYEGDRVLIQAAAGGVGSIQVQIAKSKGCIVYGTASSGKQDFLRELGVDFPIDYTKEDFSKSIKESLGDYPGIDVVFDSIGGKSFKQAFTLLAPGGRLVFIGAASQLKNGKANLLNTIGMAAGFGLYSPIQMIMQSKAMIGVNMLRIADGRPHVFKSCLDNVVKMWDSKVIKPHIHQVLNANDISQAHQLLESRQSKGKVVCQW